MGKNILIDTDVGNDDLIAILMLLLSNKEIQVSGISTVSGVSKNAMGARNLARILTYCKTKIPIFQGAEKALVEKKAQFPIRDKQRAENLTLLSDLKIPAEGFPVLPYKEFTNMIFNPRVKEKFTLLALGPLTNIAKLINDYKDEIKQKISRITLMGGGLNIGNVPPLYLAEYNMYLDPEAAKIVFSSGIPITMVGINATADVPATDHFKKRIRRTKKTNPKAEIIRKIILNNERDFDAFYDPVAAIVLLDDSIITKCLSLGIEVVLTGKNRGQTKTSSKNRNVYIVMNINAESFYNKLTKL